MTHLKKIIIAAALAVAAFAQSAQALTGYALAENNFYKFGATNEDAVTYKALDFVEGDSPTRGTNIDIEYSLVDNKLYLLTSGNRIYIIDPRHTPNTPGAKVAVHSIGNTPFADPATFQPAAFAIHPETNEIRVIGTLGQNVRVNAATGAMISTDTPLAYKPGDLNEGEAPQINRIAFTPGPGSTLFGYDLSLVSTVRIGDAGNAASADTGVLSTIGQTLVPWVSEYPVQTYESGWAGISPEGQALYHRLDMMYSLIPDVKFFEINLATGATATSETFAQQVYPNTYNNVAFVEDPDNDNVLGINDLCPNSPFGVAVDASGCPLQGLDLTGSWAAPKVKCNTKKGFCTASSTFYVLPSEPGENLSFNVNFHQSRFPALDKPATLLFTKHVKIKKGKPAKVKVKASNLAITAAPIYLIADIDVTDQVTEVNEINNESSQPVM